MAVTASGNDPNGKQLDATIANLTSQLAVINSSTSTLAYNRVKQELNYAQVAAVTYYMSTGRISAATILSTLS